MSLLPTAAEAALQERVRTFAHDKLLPHARRIDEESVFRRESIAELAQAGILGGPIGTAFGGQGWTPSMLALAHEELGAVCGNTRGFLAVHTCLVAQNLERHGTPEQQRAWLPRLVDGSAIGCFGLTEEEAGSDVGALRTTAVRRGDRWVLSGRKIWITNGGVADLITLFATEDPAAGTKGITGFLVPGDAPGLRREKMPGKELGHRGSDHAALVLDQVEVPDSAVFGPRRQGFKVAMDGLFHGRISVAAGAVGCHRAALEACLAFARSRQQFGKTLGEFQMVQERLADMATELEAARLLVRRCALLMNDGRCTPVELAMAKLYATEAAFRACEQAVLLHGGRGYSSAYPVERLLRDVMGMRIYEGTTLIQKTIIARKLLGPT